MAEAPIGKRYRTTSTRYSALMLVTVLDGGTGFLKVGYAAQVRQIDRLRAPLLILFLRTSQSIPTPL